MIFIILIILLCCGGFGSYHTWGNPAYGPAYGGGIGISTIVLVLLIWWLISGRGQG